MLAFFNQFAFCKGFVLYESYAYSDPEKDLNYTVFKFHKILGKINFTLYQLFLFSFLGFISSIWYKYDLFTRERYFHTSIFKSKRCKIIINIIDDNNKIHSTSTFLLLN